MSEAYNVTQAGTEDLDELAVLFDQYRVFYHQASDPERARTFLFDRLSHLESVIFIARDPETNQLAGFTQLYPAFSSISMKKSWILNDLYVHEDFRKRGIAGQLLKKAAFYAELTKAKGIELSTAITNVKAQRLYESLGYKRDEEYLHYYLAL